MRTNKDSFQVSRFDQAKILLCLMALAALMHFIVLRFIFPGFYQPLTPFHSDFYLPAGLAQADFLFVWLIYKPRPITRMLLKFFGQFGIEGSIAAIILLIFFNCAITAWAFWRVSALVPKLPFVAGFVVYVYLIFSQPFFFTFSVHDVFSQISYALLAVALCFLISQENPNRISVLAKFGALALTGFLAKETYAISFIFLVALWSLPNIRGHRSRVLPPILVAVFRACFKTPVED